MRNSWKKNKICARLAGALCLLCAFPAPAPVLGQQALQAALQRAAQIGGSGDEDAAPKTLCLFLGRARRCEATDSASCAALYSLSAQTLWEYATGTNFDDGFSETDRGGVIDSLIAWTEKSLCLGGQEPIIPYRALRLMRQLESDFPQTDRLERIRRTAAKAQAKVPAGFSGDFEWDGLPDMRYTAQIYREMGFPQEEKKYRRDSGPGKVSAATTATATDSCPGTALQTALRMSARYDSGKNWRALWPVLRSFSFTEGGFSQTREIERPEYETTLEVCRILSRIPYNELSGLTDWTRVMRPAFHFMGARVREDFRRIFWVDPLPDTATMVPPQDKVRLWFLCGKWKDMKPQLQARDAIEAYGRMISHAGLKPEEN